jgi:hypothetical protein
MNAVDFGQGRRSEGRVRRRGSLEASQASNAGGAEVEDAAEVEGVVEGGALVVEHDVVGAGDAHDGVGSRCPNIVRRQSVSS